MNTAPDENCSRQQYDCTIQSKENKCFFSLYDKPNALSQNMIHNKQKLHKCNTLVIAHQNKNWLANKIEMLTHFLEKKDRTYSYLLNIALQRIISKILE